MDVRAAILMLLGIVIVLAAVLGLGALDPTWSSTAGIVAPLVGVLAFIGLIVAVVFGRD